MAEGGAPELCGWLWIPAALLGGWVIYLRGPITPFLLAGLLVYLGDPRFLGVLLALPAAAVIAVLVRHARTRHKASQLCGDDLNVLSTPEP